ncbi:hypothetical protein JCM19236_4569 [Vibrio sp. JCM 19236]|nr:hypothetical protein JCM19236_4569 [Vibrio sp. JCM 19236]
MLVHEQGRILFEHAGLTSNLEFHDKHTAIINVSDAILIAIQCWEEIALLRRKTFSLSQVLVFSLI